MATIALDGGGSSITDIVGNNAIGSALGLTSGALTPLAFATKFGAGSIFSSSSLAYEIRARNNFDVIFHWFPTRSQIRTYFANAFTAQDTDDIKYLIRKVTVPNFVNALSNQTNNNGEHFKCAIPGNGVNGEGNLSIEFLATEFSFLDHIFYQWINETESPFWIYTDSNAKDVSPLAYNTHSDSQGTPFTRADIEIKYYSSNNKELHSVICYGAFPVKVTTMDVDNDMNFTSGYQVDFAYDSIIVSSPFVDSGGSWAAAATKALGLDSMSNTAPWTSTIQDDMLANYLNKSLLTKASRFMNKVTNKVGGAISGGLNKAQKALGV